MPKQYAAITKEILTYVAIGGAIALAATSPYFAQNILYQLFKKRSKTEINRRKFSQALSRLKRNRLLILEGTKNHAFLVQLTEKGKRKIKELQFENLAIEKQKTWDKKWRLVLFDIPEKKKTGREVLRDKLKNLGFYQLQKSVFAFPYPCEQEIEFIVEFFELYPYVNFIETEKIKNDLNARKYFHLL